MSKIAGFFDLLLGFLMDILPIVCILLILSKAGTAYAEGYGLFVQKGMDAPGSAHTEMVTITEQEAGSALAVGKVLQQLKLIRSRYSFALKAKLSGYDGALLPGQYILSSDMTAEQMLEKLSVPPGAESAGQEGADAQRGEGEQERSSTVKENRDVWGQ